MSRGDLTEAEWRALKGLLPVEREAGKRGWRCVRVVHGKGNGSPGREPVLKARVRRWLVQKEEVIAFVEPRNTAGGAGAVLVLLRQPQHLLPLRPQLLLLLLQWMRLRWKKWY